MDNEFDDYLAQVESKLSSVAKLEKEYPEAIYLTTVKEIQEDIQKSANKVIQKYRNNYTKLDSFKDKTNYFSTTLLYMEKAYKKMSLELQMKPLPYKFWITVEIYERMKVNGYKATIAENVQRRSIYENSI